MSFWEAAFMAAAVTAVLIGFLADKIIDVDFSCLLKRNWKSTKCKKMLAQRKGPWQGTNLQGEIRKAFDMVLLPLGKADKGLLPARMDKNFRRRIERQIALLERRKLCREIRLTDVVPPAQKRLPALERRRPGVAGVCPAVQRPGAPAPKGRRQPRPYGLPKKRPSPGASVKTRPSI